MKKFLILVSLVLICGAALAAAELANNDKHYSWRYKMTVEIETPEGVKTGSAVREVMVEFTPRPGFFPRDPQYDVHKSLKGEAVVVDLGERGKVFAVQRYDDISLPFRVFKGPPGLTIEGAEFYSHLKAKKALDSSQYPMFVMFRDMNDPLSVQLVYGNKATQKMEGLPYVFQDNFEQIFGDGIQLKNIQIEMTEEPVVYEIKKYLPWLDKYRNKLFDGKRIHTIDAENSLANRLGAGSFTSFEGEE